MNRVIALKFDLSFSREVANASAVTTKGAEKIKVMTVHVAKQKFCPLAPGLVPSTVIDNAELHTWF